MITNIDIVTDLDLSTNIHRTAFTEIAKFQCQKRGYKIADDIAQWTNSSVLIV